MAIFPWKLFGQYIPETTQMSTEETELSPERMKETPKDMQDSRSASEYRKTEAEDGYAISDAVLEAYYLCCLRKIDKPTDPERPGEEPNGADNCERPGEEPNGADNCERPGEEPNEMKYDERPWEDPNRAENCEHLVEYLNGLDKLLFLWVQSGKDLVQSLEADFAAIPQEGGTAVQNIAGRYAQEAYQWLRVRDGSVRNLLILEEELYSALPGSQEELRRYLYELREKLILYREDGTGLSTIYTRLRELPRFLGSPFQERYALYERLVTYNAISGKRKSPKVVEMLLEGRRFRNYCYQRINGVAAHFANVQNEICGTNAVADEKEMIEKYQRLQEELAKIPITNREYNKNNRCFCVFEVTTSSRKTELYVSFSGLFDAVDPIIQNKFRTKHPALDSALDAVTAAVRGQFSEPVTRVRTTVDVKYYYRKSKRVTLGQVCDHVVSGFEDLKRMFSCCERKVFAELEKKTSKYVKKCTIYIKILPCELCKATVNKFRCKVIAGLKEKPKKVERKRCYDKLAQDICSGRKSIPFICP